MVTLKSGLLPSKQTDNFSAKMPRLQAKEAQKVPGRSLSDD